MPWHAAVRLRLVQEGREQFHSTGSGDLADVLVEVFGLDAFRDMLEVSPLPPSRPDLPPVEVYGFTSVPGLNRSNRSQIVLFVNGRLVADPSLTYAVVQAYHTLLPAGRYPLAVLVVCPGSGRQRAPDQSRGALPRAGCGVRGRTARGAAGGHRSGPCATRARRSLSRGGRRVGRTARNSPVPAAR
jgi:hypothetical protein